MPAKSPAFVDGVANISLIDGVIRIDLAVVDPNLKDKEKLALATTDTLVTTIPGFLRMHDQMSQLVSKLVEQGILKKKEPDAPVITPTGPSKSKAANT